MSRSGTYPGECSEMGRRVSFCGPLTVAERAVTLSEGFYHPITIGGCVRVLSPTGEVLFEGDWLDCNEWASAHKEDF